MELQLNGLRLPTPNPHVKDYRSLQFTSLHNQRWVDPDAFSRDIFGISLWDKQREGARSVIENKLTAEKSCPAVGKSFGAAISAWHFLMVFPPSIVITTAPTDRQVEKILWAKMHELQARAYSRGFPFGGRLLVKEWKSGTANWYGIGFATNDAAAAQYFQGFHEGNILVIFDEANGITDPIYRSADMIMTTPGSRQLLKGNPIRPSGEFYQAFKRPDRYHLITTTAFDVPNVKENREVIPGLVTREWVEDKREKWGEGSALWNMLVMAEFPAETESALIPLSWVEAAERRWLSFKEPQGQEVCTCDPGLSDGDPTAFVWRIGNYVTRVERYRKFDTMQTLGRLVIEQKRGVMIGVDPIGIGAGIINRATEQDIDIVPIDFRYRTDRTDITGTLQFHVLRDALWYALHEALDPNGNIKLCIPPDESLREDLTAPTWFMTSVGKIKIEAKDKIKARLGRSTDTGDALAMSLYMGYYGSSDLDMDPDEGVDRTISGDQDGMPGIFRAVAPGIGYKADAMFRRSVSITAQRKRGGDSAVIEDVDDRGKEEPGDEDVDDLIVG